MPTRKVNLTEHLDASSRAALRWDEDQAKLEWLRAAAKEGFDQLDYGDYVILNSEQELDAFFDQIHQEVSDQRKPG